MATPTTRSKDENKYLLELPEEALSTQLSEIVHLRQVLMETVEANHKLAQKQKKMLDLEYKPLAGEVDRLNAELMELQGCAGALLRELNSLKNERNVISLIQKEIEELGRQEVELDGNIDVVGRIKEFKLVRKRYHMLSMKLAHFSK